MPDNLQRKISISFDVEDWYHTPVITGYSFSLYPTVAEFFNSWKGRYDYLTIPFKENIRLLKEKNIRATFFVVADILERYPEVADILKNSDHEIACHSLHHQIPINPKSGELIQNKSEWFDDLVEAKERLESYFGKEITGYRAPGAFFADWMVEYIEQAGFKYDSSVAFNSLYNKTNVLLRDIPTYPYYMDNKTLGKKTIPNGIVQIPWSYYTFMNAKLPLGGAFFYRLLGNYFFERGLRQCLSKGDTMFYMHPLDFSNETFPLHNHWKRPAYWINKGDSSRKRLSQLIDAFSGNWITCQECYLRFIKESPKHD